MELLQFARSRRGGELIGIVILAAGICLALALFTYRPDDSSAFYTSTNSVVANWIGYYGATIAWLFVGFFGFPPPRLIAAAMNAAKSGCALFGFDWNSGCACVPRNQGWFFSSITSTRFRRGFTPLTISPAFSICAT